MGEFRTFNAHHPALAIRGAIKEFLSETHKPGVSVDGYGADLIELVTRMTAQP